MPPPAMTVFASTARAIGRAVHPGPIGGIQRNIAHRSNASPSPGSRDGALGHLEMLWSEFPAGFSTSKTWRLTVSFIAFPPSVGS